MPRGASVSMASGPSPVTGSPLPSKVWSRSTTIRPVRVVMVAATSARRDGFSTVTTRSDRAGMARPVRAWGAMGPSSVANSTSTEVGSGNGLNKKSCSTAPRRVEPDGRYQVLDAAEAQGLASNPSGPSTWRSTVARPPNTSTVAAAHSPGRTSRARTRTRPFTGTSTVVERGAASPPNTVTVAEAPSSAALAITNDRSARSPAPTAVPPPQNQVAEIGSGTAATGSRVSGADTVTSRVSVGLTRSLTYTAAPTTPTSNTKGNHRRGVNRRVTRAWRPGRRRAAITPPLPGRTAPGAAAGGGPPAPPPRALPDPPTPTGGARASDR